MAVSCPLGMGPNLQSLFWECQKNPDVLKTSQSHADLKGWDDMSATETKRTDNGEIATKPERFRRGAPSYRALAVRTSISTSPRPTTPCATTASCSASATTSATCRRNSGAPDD